AYRMDGTVIAHGGNPALIGQNLIATVDADGVPVIAGLVRLAATGGGWLAYRWPNPATGEEAARKIGYVVPIDTTWFLGSGAYGAAALPPTEAAARTLLAQALDTARSLPRAEALARFADPAGPFTVGQLRVVAVDADGLLLADPYAPALVGRPALPGLGLDGAAGRDAFLAAAADPADGSIDVLAGDPTTGGRLGPRRLLVADVDGAWTLVVGFPAPDPAG
ncbi:MAG: cache domain-containing protein, partial [Chloroflexota bacterium]